jgi:hypothetical protein
MSFCLRCWRDLDSCRTQGMGGVGPISFLAVLEWARFYRCDRELTLMLVEVIRDLDVKRAEREASERALKGTR